MGFLGIFLLCQSFLSLSLIGYVPKKPIFLSLGNLGIFPNSGYLPASRNLVAARNRGSSYRAVARLNEVSLRPRRR